MLCFICVCEHLQCCSLNWIIQYVKRPEATGGHVITQQVCVCARYSMVLLENSQSHNLKHTRPAPGEVTREERKERQGRDKKKKERGSIEAMKPLIACSIFRPVLLALSSIYECLSLSLSHMSLCFSIPPHCTLLKWLLQGKLEFKMRFYYKIFVTDTRCAGLQMRKARVVEWKVT